MAWRNEIISANRNQRISVIMAKKKISKDGKWQWRSVSSVASHQYA